MKLYRLIGISIAMALCQNNASAEESELKSPSQLKGKSIIVSYLETRKAKPEEGGAIATRKVPFKLIIYVSAEGICSTG